MWSSSPFLAQNLVAKNNTTSYFSCVCELADSAPADCTWAFTQLRSAGGPAEMKGPRPLFSLV